MSQSWRSGTNRLSMALRGALAVVLVSSGSMLAVLGGGNFFSSGSTVTTRVPVTAGPVQEQSAIRYRGVVVGNLEEVRANDSGAELVLHIDEEHMGRIPAAVRTRILPRTLFGDQFVSLATPEQPLPEQPSAAASGGTMLAGGSVIPADTSRKTVQMYQAYTRLHSLLATFQPAKFQVALTTVADVLRGRGERIGEMIDSAHRLSGRFQPHEVTGNMGEVAELSRQLADSAPDLLATLDNAVSLSRTVVEEKESITSLFSAGIELTATSKHVAETHVPRAIEVVHAFEPVSDVLAGHPGQTTETLNRFDHFLRNASRTFRDGRFNIRAPVTLDDPHPYTSEECPRYPDLDGPNCTRTGEQQPREFGGTAGPVGSEREQDALMEMAQTVLGPRTTEPNPDMLGVLFGPIARGTQVVVP